MTDDLTVATPSGMHQSRGLISRRNVLRAGAIGAVGAGAAVAFTRGGGEAVADINPFVASYTSEVHLGATDGWVSMPSDASPVPGYWPDELAPPPYDMYVFGFRNLTTLLPTDQIAQRGAAQISAPLLAFDEGSEVKITLTNLGLSQRPDLTDGHTVHWHGFNNAIPLFDGVPELSASVPIGKSMVYYYRPHDAGTFMYHCHFEDVEHVQMGMTGLVFVRPLLNYEFDLATTISAAITDSDTTVAVASTATLPQPPFIARLDAGTAFEEEVNVTVFSATDSTVTLERGALGTTARPHAAGTQLVLPGARQIQQRKDGDGKPLRFLYNDATTRYDREFPVFLSENQPESHWRDAHIQITDWAQYSPGFALINGRAYPDTLEIDTDPMYDYVEDPENRYPLDPDHHPVQATDPNWIRRNQLQRLRYQPHGSVIECNAGEIIALRIASLGYIRHTLTLDGVPLHVVGADATQLKSKDDGTNNSYDTNSVDVAPGESRDVLFTAPAAGTYLLYDRNFSNLSNSGAGGYGGMITEVRVHASGFPAQSVPPKAGV